MVEEKEIEICTCNLEYYELRSEGVPCGWRGCSTFVCCHTSWKDHMVTAHPNSKVALERRLETKDYDDEGLIYSR